MMNHKVKFKIVSEWNLIVRKVSLILFVCLLLSCELFSQANPGNVGTTNLTGWWKPDALAIGDVTNWTTTFSVGMGTISLTDGSAPYPQATNTPANAISNYNTTLFFNNNTNVSLKVLKNTGALDLLDNASAGDQGTFFCVYYLPTSTQNDHMLLYNESGNDAIQLRNLNASGRLAIGRNLGANVNATRNWSETLTPTIISYKGNRTSGASMKAFEDSKLSTISSASQSSGAIGMYIGTGPNANTSPYNGYVHEYIFYNQDLTPMEMARVHTYLAIKYGITLQNVGGGAQGDYYATEGTLIWDADLNPTYHNDVIGIGRDDDEDLNQLQSHSFDDDSRIYVDLLAVNNVSNGGNIINNVSYITVGHDTGSSCSNATAALEMPVNINARLQREWKITNTNFNQVFHGDFKVTACAIADASLESELRLLVDDDGDFSNAMVYSEADGIDFIITPDGITVRDISNTMIPTNSTRYITFAVQNAPAAILPFASHLCLDDSIGMVVSISGSILPIDFTYSDGATTYTVPNTLDGDTIYVWPIVTTTYTAFNEGIFGCCGYTAPGNSETLIVYDNPTAVTSMDTTICENAVIDIWGEGNGANSYTYYWSHTTSNDSLQNIAPTTDTTYSVSVIDNFGCASDTASIQITLFDPLSGTISPDVSICPGFDVVLEATATGGNGAPYTFSWNPGPSSISNGSDQITVSPVDTIFYTLTVTDVCESTPMVMTVSVNVAGLPDPSFEVLNPVQCEPAIFDIINTTDPALSENVSWFINDEQFFIDQDTIATGPWMAGDYDIFMIVVSPQGCIDSAYYPMALHVNPVPTANFIFSPNPPTMFLTEVVFNNGSIGAVDYIWTFEEGNPATSTIEHPTTNFPDGEIGTYEVELIVISEFACSDTMILDVQVYPEVLIYAPNAFTPDGDEFNQGWRVYMEGIDTYNFNLKIFNRWGETIWETNDFNQSWDGTYNGNNVPTGTYIWVVSAKDFLNDDKHTFKGHVNVLR